MPINLNKNVLKIKDSDTNEWTGLSNLVTQQIDSTLSETSTNPIQNATVTKKLNQLSQDKADYQYVDEKVSNVKVDLTGYAKEDYVDAEIEELNKKIVQETGKLSQEIADLKASGIIVVQNGNTLTIEGSEE